MSGLLATLFVASLASAVVLIPLMIRIARKVGFLDHPGPRKIHAEPIPYGAGIVVAAAVLTAGFAASRHGLPAAPKAFPFVVYALGSLVILVLGLVDDRRRLSAGFKLLVQTIVAVGVAVGGERLRMFDIPFALSVAVTVLWILAVTNAFNLLDHTDGLSSGVALLAGSAFLVVALQTRQALIPPMIVPPPRALPRLPFFHF